jgi:hypothetical protein
MVIMDGVGIQGGDKFLQHIIGLAGEDEILSDEELQGWFSQMNYTGNFADGQQAVMDVLSGLFKNPNEIVELPEAGCVPIDPVDETVDETEEFKADNNIKPKGAMVQNIHIDQNYIEQNKPTKPNKPQKQFDTSKQDLIEYDDEKPLNLVVPLPGM